MKIEPLGFCDTNIYVDFSLIPKFDDFLNKYKRLNISDAVFDELRDWSRQYYDYSFIYDNLIEHIENNTIVVVRKDDFSNFEKNIIKRRLESVYDILKNYPEQNKKHLNKGEIVSAVYAEVIGAPFIQSNDNFPGLLKSSEFRNITFYNRMDILKQICNSIKECSHFNRMIDSERIKMDKSFKKSKQITNAQLPVKDNMLKELADLKDKLEKL